MNIIIKPIVTEKVNAQGEKFNRYGFNVAREANKLQIQKAIQDMYDVTVVAVNTMSYKGKKKSRYTKTGIIRGKTSDYKRAIVTVKQGEKIDFYSNI